MQVKSMSEEARYFETNGTKRVVRCSDVYLVEVERLKQTNPAVKSTAIAILLRSRPSTFRNELRLQHLPINLCRTMDRGSSASSSMVLCVEIDVMSSHKS